MAANLDEILAQEEQVLKAAVAQTMADYHRDRSVENSRRWESAKKALADFNRRADTERSNEERFKNQKEALGWLQSRGQISAGKFSGDCRSGLITVHTDKSISRWQVMEYAEKLFGGVRVTPKAIDLSDKKARLEIEKLEQDVEKGKLANRKEDEKWLYKDEAWAQMAAIVGKLRDSIRHQLHIGTNAIITSAGGDHNRGPEVYETCEGLLSRAFNEIVEAGKIEGVFEKTNENE